MKKIYVGIILVSLCLQIAFCGILFALLQPRDNAMRSKASNSPVTEKEIGSSGKKADTTQSPVTEKDATDSSIADKNSNVIVKDFGSYTIPDGWEESVIYSTKDKFFYFENGKENETQPDNIYVNVGTNPYSVDENMDFRDSIKLQLLQQIAGKPNATLTGSGSTTDQGYLLYAFTLSVVDDWGVITQYYIVGEYKYCMVYLTNFDGSEEAEKAAKDIVNSFVWAED